MRLGCILLVLLATLGGCTRFARFYPANEQAAATGVLQAEFIPYGLWQSPMTLLLPDGELLRGEASVVRGGAIAFGSLLGTVYGPVGTPFGTAMPAAIALPGGNPGVANLFGSRGTALTCEFLTDPINGHGYGACETSKGALYRMQY